MSDTSPETLHQAVHRSLSEGDFERAGQIGNDLGQAIIREAECTNNHERAKMLQENLGRLEEHLSLARILRAHLANQLQTNTALFHYQTGCDPAHCWRFDA